MFYCYTAGKVRKLINHVDIFVDNVDKFVENSNFSRFDIHFSHKFFVKKIINIEHFVT